MRESVNDSEEWNIYISSNLIESVLILRSSVKVKELSVGMPFEVVENWKLPSANSAGGILIFGR